MDTIKLVRVYYMPRVLEPGSLYYSEELGIAGHLCACGCVNKTITPIDPIEWSLTITDDKPTLEPSIGNWELPCKSHYWITEGAIRWSNQWSEKEILAGRQREDERRKAYYSNREHKQKNLSIFSRILNWIFKKN